MKRLFTFIVTIIYFCISSGFVMSVHYCMGKVNKINVEIAPSKSCICGKKEMKGCCKTQHKFIKLEDNHKPSAVDFAFQSPVQIIESPFNHINVAPSSVSDRMAFHNHYPPLIPQQDINLLHCVFRI